MVYQGSKNRLARYIVPILQKYIDDNNIEWYYEPFVGGANIIDKIKCKNKIGSDINDELISLLKYAQNNNELELAPEECSFEHYSDVRSNRNTGKYSKEYVALIGYCASYGGRYFDGGYGRDSKGGRSIYAERLKNLKEQAPSLSEITLLNVDYLYFLNQGIKNSVFYLDPPYKGTKQYTKQSIDYDDFYNFCRELSKDNIVIISEYYMPEDFVCIWQKERKVLQKSDRIKGDETIEKLFIHQSKIKE